MAKGTSQPGSAARLLKQLEMMGIEDGPPIGDLYDVQSDDDPPPEMVPPPSPAVSSDDGGGVVVHVPDPPTEVIDPAPKPKAKPQAKRSRTRPAGPPVDPVEPTGEDGRKLWQVRAHGAPQRFFEDDKWPKCYHLTLCGPFGPARIRYSQNPDMSIDFRVSDREAPILEFLSNDRIVLGCEECSLALHLSQIITKRFSLFITPP